MHEGVGLGLGVMQMAEVSEHGVRNVDTMGREDLYQGKAHKAVLW